jgi:hypothetical protein
MEQETPQKALLWHDIDALLTMRIFYAVDCSMEAATLVTNALAFHQRKRGFDDFMESSIDKILKTLPAGLFSQRSLHRAFGDLVEMGVFETKPVVRNTAKQFRLVPERLMELMLAVDSKAPGLTSIPSGAGYGTLHSVKK